MKAKIIQIAAVGVANNHITQCNAFLYALDERGKIWVQRDTDNCWYEIQLPNYQQNKEVKENA